MSPQYHSAFIKLGSLFALPDTEGLIIHKLVVLFVKKPRSEFICCCGVIWVGGDDAIAICDGGAAPTRVYSIPPPLGDGEAVTLIELIKFGSWFGC